MTKPDSRPNLVWFMPDQQRTDAVGCFGNPVVQTPTIDGLADRGTRFTNAFVQHPVCGPSRVSHMTGWYPHTAGHRTLDNLIKPHEPNLLRLLKDAGYYVAYPGSRGDVFAPGVTEASTDFCGLTTQVDMEAMGRNYTPDTGEGSAMMRAFYFGQAGDEPNLDIDEATIQTALEWIANGAPTDRPWCLWVPLIFPHPPFVAPEPWFSLHDRADVPLPIDRSATANGKPKFMDAYREIYGWDDVDEAGYREITATYYGMVSRTDDQLRRLMEAVDQVGQADRTGWIYGTDHGEYLGDYGLVEKWPSAMDPQITQNPLIISLPDKPQGQVCDAMVEMVDLLPTLLEAADTEAQHTHFGRSLLPLLDDASLPHRGATFSEGGFRVGDEHLLEISGWIYEPKGRLQHERTELVGLASCARTPEWSYVHRAYEGDELYDRASDPSETINLVVTKPDDPIVVAAATDMRTRLLDWHVETSDVIPWVSDPRQPDLHHGYR